MAKNIEISSRAWKSRLKDRAASYFGREYLKDSTLRAVFIITAILAAIAWLIAVFNYAPSEYLVPTRYNSFLGVTQLGNWYDLYYVPGVMMLCIFVNIILSRAMYAKDKMVSYILAGANIFIVLAALLVIINLGRLLSI